MGNWDPLSEEERQLTIDLLNETIKKVKQTNIVTHGMLHIILGALYAGEEVELYIPMKLHAQEALQRAQDNARFLRLMLQDEEGDDDG